MNDAMVGRAIRSVRLRLGLRQEDVAVKAKVSQRHVAQLELGRLDGMSLRSIRSIARVLDVDVALDVRWNGGDVNRLLDRTHAALVEHVVAVLRDGDWEIRVEQTFNRSGERGSVDVVAWHARTRTLLLVEVKSRIVDLQELFATFGRKMRIVPQALEEREGWDVGHVARLLVVLGTSANRNAVAAHAATFETTFPQRGAAIRHWLRRPSGPLAGLWFVPTSAVPPTSSTARRRVSRSGGSARQLAGPESVNRA